MEQGHEGPVGLDPDGPDVARLAPWVGGLAVALVEMAQGRRPVTTLDPIATPSARRRIHHVVRAAARPRPGRPIAPVRLIRVRGMLPTAGAYEAAVTVGIGPRAIAVAARVEHDGTQWRIVDLVPPGAGLLPAGRRPGRATPSPTRRTSRRTSRR